MHRQTYVSKERVPYDVDLAPFAQVLDTDPPLLPRLRTLVISAADTQFDYLAFIHLLQAQRDHPGHPARLVSVQPNLYGDDNYGRYKDDWLPSSVIFEFDKLVEQGMMLRVTYNDEEEVWPDGSIGKSDPPCSKSKPVNSPTFRSLRDLPLTPEIARVKASAVELAPVRGLFVGRDCRLEGGEAVADVLHRLGMPEKGLPVKGLHLNGFMASDARSRSEIRGGNLGGLVMDVKTETNTVDGCHHFSNGLKR
ncbi:hypothetical protein B0H13DRAFT_1853584 [Mycena leptocephala]|nr:hypothetical protein B0H13DRAFT_1853584 [Mycena leptocephala]